MTEAEWLVCTDPQPMIAFVRGKVSDRKLRLFACGCCRQTWHLLDDDRSRTAVETAERFADGEVGVAALSFAFTCAADAYGYLCGPLFAPSSDLGPPQIRVPTSANAMAAAGAANAARHEADYYANHVIRRTEQPPMLRDLFGCLLFRSLTIPASSLAWNAGTVVKLAQAVYDDRAFDRLPILADALEEAGCTDTDILAHCRGPGPHVRGCWVIDLILARG